MSFGFIENRMFYSSSCFYQFLWFPLMCAHISGLLSPCRAQQGHKAGFCMLSFSGSRISCLPAGFSPWEALVREWQGLPLLRYVCLDYVFYWAILSPGLQLHHPFPVQCHPKSGGGFMHCPTVFWLSLCLFLFPASQSLSLSIQGGFSLSWTLNDRSSVMDVDSGTDLGPSLKTILRL